MTTFPPLRECTPFEVQEAAAAFLAVIGAAAPDSVVEFVASGQYEQYSMLDCPDSVAGSDLFVYVPRLGRVNERIAAFDAFVADGSVFRKPYGMLSVLWRMWQYSKPFYMIIVTLIPDATWRQMAALVAFRPPEYQRFVSHAPFSTEHHYLLLVGTCLRWGRHAITPAQTVRLEALLATTPAPIAGIIGMPMNHYANWLEEWGDSLLRNYTTVQAYDAALRERVTAARRRACYNDLYSVVLGMLQTNTSPEVLREISTFALPCVHQGIVSRLEVVRLIDRMRAAMWRAEERREERSVSTRVVE